MKGDFHLRFWEKFEVKFFSPDFVYSYKNLTLILLKIESDSTEEYHLYVNIFEFITKGVRMK